MVSRRYMAFPERTGAPVLKGGREIADFLRKIAVELDRKEQEELAVPSQLGPVISVDGNEICLCLLDHSRMVAAQEGIRLLSDLSERQHEILMKLVEGLSAKAIADHFGIHPRTVEAHIYRIHQKTGTRGIAQLMRIVFSQLT